MHGNEEMKSYTELLEGEVKVYFGAYDRKLEEVIETEDRKTYLDFIREYTDTFPTFGESIYEAIFLQDEALNSTYEDFTLEKLQDGKTELPEVMKARKRHDMGKQKRPFHVDYFNNVRIKPRLKAKGMQRTDCFRFRYHQDASLWGCYTDYTLTEVHSGVSPDPVVEACRELHKKSGKTDPFYEFYFEDIYVYRLLYRRHPELSRQYTDFTLMTLREGMPGCKEVEKCKNECEKDHRTDRKEQPEEFLLSFCKMYYKSQKSLLPDAEMTYQILLGFWKDWRGKRNKQGYLFLHNTEEPEDVRGIAFHMAFAMDLDVEILQQLLKKRLLQTDFNPKNSREVIYWYCLKHKVPYSDMITQYLVYSESEEFQRDYSPVRMPTPELSDTIYWETRLQNVAGKDRNAFFHHLWLVKYMTVDPPRKTPREVFWENFRCFPKNVWKGRGENAQASIAPQEIYNSLMQGSKYFKLATAEGWSDFVGGRNFDALEKIYEAIVEYDKKTIAEQDTSKEELVVRKEREDHLETDRIKALIEKNVLKPTEAPLYRAEEYEAILPLILDKSRQNYAAENTVSLLPPETLKKLFGDLKYTKSTVKDRRTGKVSLSRTEIIATKFIGFCSDFFLLYQEKNNTEWDRLDLFDMLVSDDLQVCGMHDFYLRSPFELFVAMCFLHPDPLGYFLASMEALEAYTKAERAKKNQKTGSS